MYSRLAQKDLPWRHVSTVLGLHGGDELTEVSNGDIGGSKLTLKQQRFVDEFLIDLNATQAAIRAAQAKQAERAEIDTAWVIARLVDETQNADKSSTRVRALELLGKHLGMFSGRIDPFSLRERAIVLAEELGLPVEEVVAEAEKIMRASERRR
jgi:hypothetical protein